MLSAWRLLLKNRFTGHTKRRRRRQPIGFGLSERFEDRCLLAAVLVNLGEDTHTSEAGKAVTFSVQLDMQPTANVDVPISSSNIKEGKLAIKKLTFTPENWSAPQFVTVTGVDDFIDDDDQNYTIKFDKLKSSDVAYKNMDPADLMLTNDDNDTVGIIVSPTSGHITTERGGTATFNVKLASQPVHPVHLRMESTNFTEGTRPNPITLNSSNWKNGLNVTVRGLNDFVDDGDQEYQITFAAAESNDPKYRGLVGENVLLLNEDDDTAGLTVTPLTGLIVTEGKVKSVTVKLNSQPLSNVMISTIVTVGGEDARIKDNPVAPLIFTPANWNAAKVINIEGIQDLIVEGLVPSGLEPFQFTVRTDSDDPKYSGLGRDVSMHVKDDKEKPAMIFTPSSLPAINEGASTSFNVKLAAPPAANVTINFGSGAAGISLVTNGQPEATISPSSITFTPDNWSTEQAVTITGVRDGVLDGTKTFRFTATSQSTVSTYNGLSKSFSIQVKDTDTVAVFDGTYEGSYSGTVSGFGVSAPTSGLIRATVVNGVITVTAPEAGSGTIANNGATTFSASGGATVGARFMGTFTRATDGSVSASGSWKVTLTGFSGGGSWNVHRI